MVIKYTFIWALVGLICKITSTGYASADELSLNQAIELALNNNPTIASGQYNAEAAKHAVNGAKALSNPEISIGPNILGDAGSDTAVLISQPLEINGSRKLRGIIAESQAASASYETAVIKQDIVLRVKQTYWDIAQAQEVVRLNEDNLAYLETLHAAVQKQYDVGTIPGSQILKTDVELARAKQELAQAQLDKTLATAIMNALLNRPKDQAFTVTNPLTYSDTTFDKQQFQSLALARRSEIASIKAQLESARHEIRAVQLRLAPDVAVQARRETFNSSSSSGIAVVVTLPLVDWGSVKADKMQAESIARSQEKNLEAVMNNISLDVENALHQVATSSQTVRIYQSGILAKSEELANMAQTGYEKGAINYLEVLEAQRTLRSIKTEYYTALANYARSIAQLEWAIGSDIPGITKSEVEK